MTRFEKWVVTCMFLILAAVGIGAWAIQRQLTAIDLALIIILDEMEKSGKTH